MANTYGNATINIAAHPAHENQDGFLASKYAKSPSTKPFRKQNNIHCEYQYLIARFERLVDQSLLSSRGWVFQERLLSPKTLHCVDNMLFWEDHRGFFAEDGSFSDAVGVRSDWRTLRTLRDWYQLMEVYSRCNLTAESDRLPAIAGLAASFQEDVQSPFYAGVWGGKLPLGLLWLPQSQAQQSSPPFMDDISVPTWSWAYYGCPVRFIDNVELIPLVQFVQFLPIRKGSEYVVHTLSGEAYLSVRAGILWMQEVLNLRMQVLRNGLVGLYSELSELSLGSLKLDARVGPPDISNIWLLQIARTKPKYGGIGRAACSRCELDSGHAGFHNDNEWDAPEIYVLVLTVDEAGCYRRIGLGLVRQPLFDDRPYVNIMIK
ncbi:MAG: hypothetical protein M1821_006631 [Bathelium mastoideum]|nr:MAG: hypothetical protein M1821_006631 [Bathelium mastoideum]